MEQPRISGQMLLAQLEEDQARVDRLRHELRDALDARNETVQSCRDIRLPVSTIGRKTGLSAQAINKIAAKRTGDSSPRQYDSAAH
jgi:hypothetical protein